MAPVDKLLYTKMLDYGLILDAMLQVIYRF